MGPDVGELEGAAAGGSVTWKAIWMALMVCCAVRQLLSCIQVSRAERTRGGRESNRRVEGACSAVALRLGRLARWPCIVVPQTSRDERFPFAANLRTRITLPLIPLSWLLLLPM